MQSRNSVIFTSTNPLDSMEKDSEKENGKRKKKKYVKNNVRKL